MKITTIKYYQQQSGQEDNKISYWVLFLLFLYFKEHLRAKVYNEKINLINCTPLEHPMNPLSFYQ